MPKSKETISESDSGSSEEEVKQKSKSKKQEKKKSSASEASDSEEDTKAKKRTKKMKDDNKASKKAKKENDQGESFWDLDNKKRITVRSFKGKLLIDIREYYEDNKGDLKPSKKGISLNPENWSTLTQIIDEVNQCIKSQ